MLSGQRAFRGDTAIDAMTAILKEHPPDLPAAERKIPPALVRIVDRCLEKSPAARVPVHARSGVCARGAVDRVHIVWSRRRARRDRGRKAARTRTDRLDDRGCPRCRGSGVAREHGNAVSSARPAEQQSIQFAVSPPEGWSTRTATGAARSLAMSPDGRRLAFIAADKDGRTMAWVRSLDATVAQSLKGTENAGSPFWSPDSRFLAFVADGKLKKIDVAGGPPQTIADAAASGGTWSPDGTIVFNASGNGPLSRVSATGGAVSPVTTLEQGEVTSYQSTLPA